MNHRLDNDKQVFFYENEFYVLSNFSSFQVRMWDSITFPTVEHAYQWKKFDWSPSLIPQGPRLATNLNSSSLEKLRSEILRAPSAHEAFRIAQSKRHYRNPYWDSLKEGIMLDLCVTKFFQHEYVQVKLFETGDRELIEDSWRDDVWGWGPNKDGQNLLGKVWMKIRNEFRKGPPPERG